MAAPNDGKKLIPIASPIKGINRVSAREQQEPETCWDASNVLPYDVFGRKRVAQRFGTSKQYATQLGSGAQVQGVLPIETIVYPNGLAGGLPTYTFADLTGWTIISGSWTGGGGTLTFPTGVPGGTKEITLPVNGGGGQPAAPIPFVFTATFTAGTGMTTLSSSHQTNVTINFNVASRNAGGTNWFAVKIIFTPNTFPGNNSAVVQVQGYGFGTTTISTFNAGGGFLTDDSVVIQLTLTDTTYQFQRIDWMRGPTLEAHGSNPNPQALDPAAHLSPLADVDIQLSATFGSNAVVPLTMT